MTEEQQSTCDEYEKRVKTEGRKLGTIMWDLVRCSPAEEGALLAALREQCNIKEALDREMQEWHETRPLRPVEIEEDTEIPPEQSASPDDMPIPDGITRDKWLKMVEKIGYKGACKTHAQNQKMKLLSSLSHLSYDDLLALISLDSAQADVARAQIRLSEYERLAIEGKKDRIVRIALSNADLQKEFEPNLKAKVNDQRRSSGNVVRINSGDGR